jgi:hypothetical protein
MIKTAWRPALAASMHQIAQVSVRVVGLRCGEGDSQGLCPGPLDGSRPSRPPRFSGIAKPGGAVAGSCAGGRGAGGVLGVAVAMNPG